MAKIHRIYRIKIQVVAFLAGFLGLLSVISWSPCLSAPLNASGVPTLSWQYTRADSDDKPGTLTAVLLNGTNYVSVPQFCGALGCHVVYQWAKQKLILENPRTHKVALISSLTRVAIIDGEVVDLSAPILLNLQQGYVLPVSFAQELVRRLGLGTLREIKNEPTEAVSAQGENDHVEFLVIDPGHGGADKGTGHGDLLEKDISLFYAQKLRDELRLEVPALRVIMTRENDLFVSLADRTKLANKAGSAGILISLHVNHAPDVRISGAETFILSPEATDSEARKTALAENESWIQNAKLDSKLKIKNIFVDLEQQKFIQRSAVLGAYVQQELSRVETGRAVKNRGVKQAFFYVLSQAAMPSILVEMGFLSNTKDRARLMNSSFQSAFTKALVNAIKRYRGQ